MPSLLPAPEPADPVEGQPGHFDHSNWVKASLKALDAGMDARFNAVIAPGTRIEMGQAVGDGSSWKTITFAKPFSAPPSVIAHAAPLTVPGTDVGHAIIYAVTTTSFQLSVYNLRAGGPAMPDTGVAWLAIGAL